LAPPAGQKAKNDTRPGSFIVLKESSRLTFFKNLYPVSSPLNLRFPALHLAVFAALYVLKDSQVLKLPGLRFTLLILASPQSLMAAGGSGNAAYPVARRRPHALSGSEMTALCIGLFSRNGNVWKRLFHRASP
jgi:hypothetical protein